MGTIRIQYPQLIALIFSMIGGMWLLGIGFYLCPIFPCILLSLISSYLVMRVVEKPMSPTIVDAGGSAAVILFLNGAVRVQAIRMLLGIVPALIVLAIVVHLWRQRRGVMHLASAVVLLIALVRQRAKQRGSLLKSAR